MVSLAVLVADVLQTQIPFPGIMSARNSVSFEKSGPTSKLHKAQSYVTELLGDVSIHQFLSISGKVRVSHITNSS